MQPKKIIIAPDSFKGSLTSIEVADIIGEEISVFLPDCEIIKMPIADGGEGSVETIITALGGKTYQTKVLSPDDRMIDAKYGIASNGTAIIEVAQSSGITKQKGLHPMTSNTFGFGQLILAALERGARDFILCIGGSATTDCGCGMAAALGVLFLDEKGRSFIPCGKDLCDVAKIDINLIDKRAQKSNFTVMCDVTNPLTGKNGAAFVYSPQKGASPEQVIHLDKGLYHIGRLLSELFGKDLTSIPGAGAAGGLGAGCMAFLGANLQSGIDAILELCGFEEHVRQADLIITGEGKLDSQSFYGKVLSGLLREANGVPVWSVCGVCDCDETLLQKHGVTVFEASKGISTNESMSDPAKYLRIAVQKAMQDAG